MKGRPQKHGTKWRFRVQHTEDGKIIKRYVIVPLAYSGSESTARRWMQLYRAESRTRRRIATGEALLPSEQIRRLEKRVEELEKQLSERLGW